MATTVNQSMFIKMPTALHLEIIKSLSVKDLENIRATCKQLLTTVSWEKIAQTAINQLNQYTNTRCSWCDKAIVLIQTSYNKSESDHYKIVQLLSNLNSDPSQDDFLTILKVLKCDAKLTPHEPGPCVCDL